MQDEVHREGIQASPLGVKESKPTNSMAGFQCLNSDQPGEVNKLKSIGLGAEELESQISKSMLKSKNDCLPSKHELGLLGKSQIEEETSEAIFTRDGKSFQLRFGFKFSSPPKEPEPPLPDFHKEKISSLQPTMDKTVMVEEGTNLSITPIKQAGAWGLSHSARLLDSPDQKFESEGRNAGFRTALLPGSPRISHS